MSLAYADDVEPDIDAMSVYVSNINWDTTQDQLGTFFSKFGVVKHVNLKENKVRRAPGYAFIEFQDADSVRSAIDFANNDGVRFA